VNLATKATVVEAETVMEAGSKEVEDGVVRANQTGQALADILKAVEAMNQQDMQSNRQ